MRRRAILERMRRKTNQSHHFSSIISLNLSSIGHNSDQSGADTLHQARKKRRFAQKLLVPGLLILGQLCACEPSSKDQPVSLAQHSDASCGAEGALQAAIFGGIETDIQWAAGEMNCDSMLRPNDEGIRLRFAGEVSGEQLAIIIAMPGLKRGDSSVEIPSNVTAIVEGSGRFFSTPNLDACWTEVASQTPVSDGGDHYAIDGTLYCIAALGEINGDAAISIPELSFSTIVKWSKQ